MPAPRAPLAVLAAAALALVPVAASCSSSSKTATTGTKAGSTTVASTSTTGTATTGSSAPGGSSSLPGPARCVTADLAISIGPSGAAAGSRYTPVVFANTSGHACSLFGFPGISLLDASGATIGQPATRRTSAAHGTVVLAPGSKASAAIHTVNPAVAPDCLPTSAKVRVIVPDETTPVDLPAQLDLCQHQLEVLPIVAGTSGTS